MIPLTRGLEKFKCRQPYPCKYRYSQRGRFHKTHKIKCKTCKSWRYCWKLKWINEKADCLTPKSLSLYPSILGGGLSGSFRRVEGGLAFNQLIGGSLGLMVDLPLRKSYSCYFELYSRTKVSWNCYQNQYRTKVQFTNLEILSECLSFGTGQAWTRSKNELSIKIIG